MKVKAQTLVVYTLHVKKSNNKATIKELNVGVVYEGPEDGAIQFFKDRKAVRFTSMKGPGNKTMAYYGAYK